MLRYLDIQLPREDAVYSIALVEVCNAETSLAGVSKPCYLKQTATAGIAFVLHTID